MALEAPNLQLNQEELTAAFDRRLTRFSAARSHLMSGDNLEKPRLTGIECRWPAEGLIRVGPSQPGLELSGWSDRPPQLLREELHAA